MSKLRLPTCLSLLALVLLSGCSSLNLDIKRLTYDLLRQEDCRRNDIYDFCSRTFVFEYDEYENHRREFLRAQQEQYVINQARRSNSKSLHPKF